MLPTVRPLASAVRMLLVPVSPSPWPRMWRLRVPAMGLTASAPEVLWLPLKAQLVAKAPLPVSKSGLRTRLVTEPSVVTLKTSTSSTSASPVPPSIEMCSRFGR